MKLQNNAVIFQYCLVDSLSNNADLSKKQYKYVVFIKPQPVVDREGKRNT